MGFYCFVVFLEVMGSDGSSKKLSISLLFFAAGLAFSTGFGLAGEANKSSSKSKSSFFLVIIGVGLDSGFFVNFLNK